MPIYKTLEKIKNWILMVQKTVIVALDVAVSSENDT